MSKGHWPKGRRRHDDRDWATVRKRLAKALEEWFCRGRVSIREAARRLDVSTRTVGRWLAGEDVPPVSMQRRVNQLVDRWQLELGKKKGSE